MIDHNHCKTCDSYDTARTNGDLHWCTECGDTENIEFFEPQTPKPVTKSWDVMIAHPPCTYLAVSGARKINKKALYRRLYKYGRSTNPNLMYKYERAIQKLFGSSGNMPPHVSDAFNKTDNFDDFYLFVKNNGGL